MEELNICCRCGSYMVSRNYSSSAIKYNCLQCGATFEKREIPNKQPISHIDQLIELNNKLLKYEAIESELGIPLEVLFKALKDGIIMDDEEYQTFLMYDEVTNSYCFKCGGWGKYFLKDYGKTWFLTKEELE